MLSLVLSIFYHVSADSKWNFIILTIWLITRCCYINITGFNLKGVKEHSTKNVSVKVKIKIKVCLLKDNI